MKILQICNKLPYPPADGGAMGINVFTHALIDAGHTVKVIAISTHKAHVKVEDLPSSYVSKTSFETVFIDTRVKPFPALINLIKGKSYNISRFYSTKLDQRLAELLQDQAFDIIQLESIFVTPYLETIRKYSKAKIVVRAHNVEFKIWERLAVNERNPFKAFYLKRLSETLKNYELSVLNKVDGVTTVTSHDSKLLTSLGVNSPVKVVPFGVAMKGYTEAVEPEQRIFHFGAMDWMPNIEGIDWFLNEVWPLLNEKFPNLKFFFAGRHMPERFLNLNLKNVFVETNVPDAEKYLQDKQIMVVPLLSGSGVRVKVIEGMAMAKTIIATTVGAEGIEYENNKHLIIADTPQDFVDAVEKCLNDQSLKRAIASNARELAIAHYDIKNITRELTNFYNQI